MNSFGKFLKSPLQSFFKFTRTIYEKTLEFSQKKASSSLLFSVAIAEAIFFPIPPDVLILTLGFGNPRKALWFSSVASVGSVLGGVLGYLVGHFLWQAVDDFFFSLFLSREDFEKVAQLYNENAFLAVFTAGFTPIPYKVFTISAGVFGINFGIFLLASAISRSARFFAEGILIFFFGERAREFLEKHFNTFTIIFTILLIGGFLLLKVIK